MRTVFILQHSHPSSIKGEEDTKLIGVYSSRKNAEKAIERLSKQPGFVDWSKYFYIDEYEIDRDNWAEGFVTLTHEPVWAVWRQDDNGHTFLVRDGLTQLDALKLVREMERKGHKQTYWAKEDL